VLSFREVIHQDHRPAFSSDDLAHTKRVDTFGDVCDQVLYAQFRFDNTLDHMTYYSSSSSVDDDKRIVLLQWVSAEAAPH
jgi:hypothetical protein